MNEQDRDIEQLLGRYRPAGPPAGLRQRVLDAAKAQAAPRTARAWAVWLYRGAVAATLLLAFGLNQAADRTARATAAMVGIGPAVWNEQAEQAARMLDGDGWGRRYIALGLMVDPARVQPQANLGTALGEIR